MVLVVELDGGDRHFVAYGLGVSRFVLDETDFEYLARFDCVHSGAGSGTEAQLEAMARAGGASFDFSDRPGEYYMPLLAKVWMACFSGTNLDTTAERDLTRQVLRAGPEVVLVTKGPRALRSRPPPRARPSTPRPVRPCPWTLWERATPTAWSSPWSAARRRSRNRDELRHVRRSRGLCPPRRLRPRQGRCRLRRRDLKSWPHQAPNCEGLPGDESQRPRAPRRPRFSAQPWRCHRMPSPAVRGLRESQARAHRPKSEHPDCSGSLRQAEESRRRSEHKLPGAAFVERQVHATYRVADRHHEGTIRHRDHRARVAEPRASADDPLQAKGVVVTTLRPTGAAVDGSDDLHRRVPALGSPRHSAETLFPTAASIPAMPSIPHSGAGSRARYDQHQLCGPPRGSPTVPPVGSSAWSSTRSAKRSPGPATARLCGGMASMKGACAHSRD